MVNEIYKNDILSQKVLHNQGILTQVALTRVALARDASTNIASFCGSLKPVRVHYHRHCGPKHNFQNIVSIKLVGRKF